MSGASPMAKLLKEVTAAGSGLIGLMLVNITLTALVLKCGNCAAAVSPGTGGALGPIGVKVVAIYCHSMSMVKVPAPLPTE